MLIHCKGKFYRRRLAHKELCCGSRRGESGGSCCSGAPRAIGGPTRHLVYWERTGCSHHDNSTVNYSKLCALFIFSICRGIRQLPAVQRTESHSSPHPDHHPPRRLAHKALCYWEQACGSCMRGIGKECGTITCKGESSGVDAFISG